MESTTKNQIALKSFLSSITGNQKYSHISQQENDFSVIIVRRTGSNRTLTDVLTQGGVVVDLTTASVAFVMRCLETNSVVTHGATIATDPTTGGVSYQLTASDVDVSGRYEYEWHVTLGGTLLVLPEAGPRAMRVVDDVGD